MVVLGSGIALAQPPPEPPAPLAYHQGEDWRGRKHPFAPIPFFYRELDLQRDNVGLPGRKNASRDEQRVAETPMLQPRPLSSW